MSGQGGQFDIRLIPDDHADCLHALHVAMDSPAPYSGTTDPQVADLLDRTRRGPSTIDLVFGAYTSERLVSACFALVSPGATAMVFLPHDQARETRRAATTGVLQSLQRSAWQRSIRLLEVLLGPGCLRARGVLEASGFRYLSTLIYLMRRGHAIERSARPAVDLNWLQYTPDREDLFCEALKAAYAQSLDCPELTGLRSTSEVLVGHRSHAGFDPTLWWVALRGETPVGVLLLSRIESQVGLEIVYIGVAQPSRGTGVADALLDRTMEAARRDSAKFVTLAVDKRNTPARKMYARWNFVETMTRAAFVASPPGT